MKKRKLQLLITVMLIFILSAQTVMAADGAKSFTIASEDTENVSENDVDVREGKLEAEAEFRIQKEVDFSNDPLSDVLTDINGNPVQTQGEVGKVKIICMGNFTDGNWKLDTDTISYLEQELGGSERVEFIVGDPDPTYFDKDVFAAVMNQAGVRYSHLCVDTVWFEIVQQIVATAIGCGSTDTIMYPTVYVVDSSNGIPYVSIGYRGDQLAPLVNYVKGMDDYTGRGEVKAFVNRLYTLVFNRQPDEAGFNDWVDKLMSKQKTGNDTAFGFFFSDEMKNRNVSDDEFVELLYKVMMNRDSDPSGKAYWLNMLQNGVSRLGVFNGFSGSTEFANICNSYGINRGTPSATEGRDRNYGATLFVARLYTQALGRPYDVDGLNDWCNRIMDRTWSITDVSTTGFFESPEFRNKNLSNEEYVKVLYRTFMGREYDAPGLADWVGKLNSGEMDRTQVLKGFSNSVEFANIMGEYGLQNF